MKRTTIVNLYLLRRACRIKAHRRRGVVQIAPSYPLNKTSKGIPGLFHSTTGALIWWAVSGGEESPLWVTARAPVCQKTKTSAPFRGAARHQAGYAFRPCLTTRARRADTADRRGEITKRCFGGGCWELRKVLSGVVHCRGGSFDLETGLCSPYMDWRREECIYLEDSTEALKCKTNHSVQKKWKIKKLKINTNNKKRKTNTKTSKPKTWFQNNKAK